MPVPVCRSSRVNQVDACPCLRFARTQVGACPCLRLFAPAGCLSLFAPPILNRFIPARSLSLFAPVTKSMPVPVCVPRLQDACPCLRRRMPVPVCVPALCRMPVPVCALVQDACPCLRRLRMPVPVCRPVCPYPKPVYPGTPCPCLRRPCLRLFARSARDRWSVDRAKKTPKLDWKAVVRPINSLPLTAESIGRRTGTANKASDSCRMPECIRLSRPECK